MLEQYPDLLLKREVMEILHIQTATAYKLIRNELDGFKQSNHWLVKKESLLDYIENRIAEQAERQDK